LPAEGHAVACAHVPRPRRTTLFPYTTLFRSIAEEYYFSILLDRANRSYLAMCSKEGGMDIEQLAEERPEALAKIEVDPNVGIDRSEEHTSELQSRENLVCRPLLEKKNSPDGG